MAEHQLEVAPQRLRVRVPGLATARGERVAEPVVDEAELRAQRLPLAVRAAEHERARQLLGVLGERVLELLGHRYAQRGVAELLCELVHAHPQQPQRGAPVQRERARERVGPDLGVAVHVAARPGAVAQDRLHEPDAQLVLDLVQHGRDGVEEHGLEEEEVAADLVLDLGPDPAQLVRLPPDRQLLAELAQQLAAAAVAGAGIVELVQQQRDVPLVVEDRAPRGLGRVRGEHVLDLQLGHQRADVDLPVAQDLRRLGERLALDLARPVVLAPAPRALALLGDVRELQLERARADDRLHGFVRDAAQVGDQPFGRGLVTRPHGGGGLEQPLQAGREHASGLLLEHAVEGVREERRVLGKAIRRLRGSRAGHIEPRHVPTKATRPCPRRRCRGSTRRRG